MSLSQAVQDAIARLRLYNLGLFNAASNPYGVSGRGGMAANWGRQSSDMAAVGSAVADLASSATTSEGNAAASASAASASAAAASAAQIATAASQSAAAASATNAQTSATAASGSATAAATSATQAAASATAMGGWVPAALLTWDSGTADADPGAGKLRLNSATLAAATALYVSTTDASGATIATVVDRWAASTNTVRGTLRIAHRQNAAKWLEYLVTGAVVSGGGYRKLTLSGGTGPGGFVAGDPVAVGFSRAGDAAAGDASPTAGTIAQRDAGGGLSAQAFLATAVAPWVGWYNSGAVSGSRWWDTIVSGTTLQHRVRSDDAATSVSWLDVLRSGTAVTAINLKAPTYINGGALNVGDRGDAFGSAVVLAPGGGPEWHLYNQSSTGDLHFFHHKNQAGTTVAMSALVLQNDGTVSVRNSDASSGGKTTLAIGNSSDTLDAFFQLNSAANTTFGGARSLNLVVNTGKFGIYFGRLSPVKAFEIDHVTGVSNFSKAVRGALTTLTYSATITPDFNAGNYFSVTLTGNATLANPSNIVAGQGGSVTIRQDATGSRTLSFGSYWKFPGGAVPSLTTTANAVDKLVWEVVSGTEIHATLVKDFR